MTCPEIHPIPALIAGIGCGFFIYLYIRCYRARYLRTIHGAIEAGVNGGGIISGLFLIFSILCPDNLVHIVSGREHLDLNQLWGKNGNGTFRQLHAEIQVVEVIAIDAVLGGLALTMACLLGLIKVCRDAFLP